MTLWHRWKKVSINNKLTIYMSAILAVATTLYTLMYRSQVKFAEENARQTSEQTNRLIAASERLAASTKEALEETKRINQESADRAERATRATENQADASVIQAETSRASARAAEQSALAATQSLAVGERPYIATKAVEFRNFEEGKKPSIAVFFDNTGKTPGLNASMRTYSAIRGERKLGEVKYPPVESVSTSVIQPGCCHRQVINAFNRDLPQEVVNAMIQAIKDGKLWLYVYGIADYEDGVGKHHTLKFCRYYDLRNAGEFTYCAEHNNSN